MTAIPTAFPLPAPLPIWAAISRGGNAVMAASFAKGGPWQLLQDWGALPVQVGCDRVLVRELATPWDWMDSLAEGARQVLGLDVMGESRLVLYTNPRQGGPWGYDELERMVKWCRRHNASVILEQDADFFWARDALRLAGVLMAIEPGISKSDRLGLLCPCIIADNEWVAQSKNVGGWNPSQVPPYDLPAGLIRWHNYGIMDGALSVPESMRAYYTECAAHPNVRAIVYAADLFKDYHMTAATVRGTA